jgi:hypothetical protein
VFLALTGIVLADVFATPASFGGEWPQFLGPSRNGISNETGLLDAWPEGGPKEVWRASGGVGMSGLAISRGRAVTLVQKDGQQWLISLDAKTGKPQWQTALSAEYKNSQGDGPRATPTTTDDTVLAFAPEVPSCSARCDLTDSHSVHATPISNGRGCCAFDRCRLATVTAP